ncbi:MAG: sigma-70 family RNA polymerase sigma factor [Maioricimonas sp. JB049]
MTDDVEANRRRHDEREFRYNEFVSLLARHDQSIRRFIRSLLLSRDGVDDVLQETALECWKKYEDFQPARPEDAPAEFVRWACVIARYKALSWQRDRARDRLVFRESVVTGLADAAMEHIHHRERQRQAVEACLESLREDDRRLVLSVHAPGESVARIAAETGQQARRLYSRVNLLRKRLLECVRRRLAGEVAHG